MIKIKLIAIGKDKDQWVADGQAHYKKLLSRFAQVESQYLPALKTASSLSPDEIKKKEAELFTKKLQNDSYIALVDNGKQFDSIIFSKQLEKQILNSQGSLTFLIGGAYGLHNSLLSKADLKLSLSPLTFSHQLVRLVLFEQLYRAFTIINNTEYHK